MQDWICGLIRADAPSARKAKVVVKAHLHTLLALVDPLGGEQRAHTHAHCDVCRRLLLLCHGLHRERHVESLHLRGRDDQLLMWGLGDGGRRLARHVGRKRWGWGDALRVTYFHGGRYVRLFLA